MRLNYGNFIQALIDFFIIAGTVFLVVKFFNQIKRKAENENDKTEVTPKDIEILSEIRDLLKEKK